MITFTDLRITNDGSKLIIKAKVPKIVDMSKDNPTDIYKNVYIKNVYIDTEKTLDGDGTAYATSKSIKMFSVDKTSEDELKEVSFVVYPGLNTVIDDLKNHLFFITVKTIGTPTDECYCDNDTWVGVTMYMGNIYNLFMSYMKEMDGNNCQIPQGLIDQLLRFKALNLSIDSGHYTQGLKYYNKWFSKTTPIYIGTRCGCNG